jgi:hypothetical protein
MRLRAAVHLGGYVMTALGDDQCNVVRAARRQGGVHIVFYNVEKFSGMHRVMSGSC